MTCKRALSAHVLNASLFRSPPSTGVLGRLEDYDDVIKLFLLLRHYVITSLRHYVIDLDTSVTL